MRSIIPEDVAALGAFLAKLKEGSIPLQRPSWQSPSYYGRPLTRTKARCVSRMQTDWTDFLVAEPIDTYKTVVQSFIAETYQERPQTGIEFRFMVNDIILTDVQIYNTKRSLNKDPETVFPLSKRTIHLVLESTDRLRLQVRNTVFWDIFVFGGIFGYYLNDEDSTIEKEPTSFLRRGATHG